MWSVFFPETGERFPLHIGLAGRETVPRCCAKTHSSLGWNWFDWWRLQLLCSDCVWQLSKASIARFMLDLAVHNRSLKVSWMHRKTFLSILEGENHINSQVRSVSENTRRRDTLRGIHLWLPWPWNFFIEVTSSSDWSYYSVRNLLGLFFLNGKNDDLNILVLYTIWQ